MNHDANIDSLISNMGKAQEHPTSNFTDEEVVFVGDLNQSIHKRIAVLLSRKVLNFTDIKLLEVLLRN
jgi:hypothetical protein